MDNSTTRLLVVLLVLLSIVSAASITYAVVKNEGGAGGASKEEIQKIIYEYLRDNPETIVNAFNEARAKQEEAELEKSKAAIVEKQDEILNDPKTPVIGAADADVTIVEFFDYNCGYCKKVLPDLLKLLDEDKKLKLALKEFPILGPQSIESAKAALAFHNLNKPKYQEFFTTLMKVTPRNNEQLFELAEKTGVKKEDLQKEMEKPEIMDHIRRNVALAESIGVRGTPAFVINGEFVRGAISIDQFREYIEQARKKKS